MYTTHREDPKYPDKRIEVWWYDHYNNAHKGELKHIWLIVLGLYGWLTIVLLGINIHPID